MPKPTITVRAGHPDFLELPWDVSLADWDVDNMVDLPKGISRHEVRFFEYPEGIYVIKELPTRPARQDYTVLRALETTGSPAVRPVGVVENRHADPRAEQSAALITEYERFSFSYRELLAGPGFGPRRAQMLDAFAELLVELHIRGVFWKDCSLSNVLYRFDAEAIETIMVDAETAELHEEGLTPGQRHEDIAIMIENVAGGMADIAGEAGADLDLADMALGEDIAVRYQALWDELSYETVLGPDERWVIPERIRRINELGFHVEELDLVPVEDASGDDSGARLRMRLQVGGRTYHSNRLKELTGIETLEHQARQILSDLQHYQAENGGDTSTGKNLAAVRWRVQIFEPWLQRLSETPGVSDPVQGFCDLLLHRYVMSEGHGYDVGNEAAYDDWMERGRPGYPLPI